MLIRWKYFFLGGKGGKIPVKSDFWIDQNDWQYWKSFILICLELCLSVENLCWIPQSKEMQWFGNENCLERSSFLQKEKKFLTS